MHTLIKSEANAADIATSLDFRVRAIAYRPPIVMSPVQSDREAGAAIGLGLSDLHKLESAMTPGAACLAGTGEIARGDAARG
jgi:hypothetical protein